MRIRGMIGDWPVDLTVELDASDWQRLAGVRQPQAGSGVAESAAALTASPADQLWLAAQDLLRRAGSSEGPQLLDELEALAGSVGGAKGLLVRLRHNPHVKVEVREGTQVFIWDENLA
ncbi:hypothetical protein [Pseudomonas schmalbachii]|uniref:Uncharacterized protein n=1 Tax=Pseudomonas schmalbachii TaxID=2816993 RepID=A0ABS3TRG2_9PSED|nr:hypothetical protein [Pseudomonas schmalbachii]MBO3275265.1 hypothetical protein [Pseudomonas schmalbachii]